MTKLAILTFAFLYAAFCFHTMPSQCGTMKYAIECQRVQVDQMIHWRANVAWGTVDSVRVF